MAESARKETMTLAEFLRWEAEQPLRHEFVDGEVFAMSGAEDRHVTIALNAAMALRQHLAGTPCRSFMSDMKLAVGEDIFYPDVFVTCSEADRNERLVKREAKLIVEVLSPSTAAYDRGEKFGHYRRIPSLVEYAVIDPANGRSDVHRKGADGLWVLHPFTAEEGIALASVDLVIDTATLLADVDPAAP